MNFFVYQIVGQSYTKRLFFIEKSIIYHFKPQHSVLTIEMMFYVNLTLLEHFFFYYHFIQIFVFFVFIRNDYIFGITYGLKDHGVKCEQIC